MKIKGSLQISSIGLKFGSQTQFASVGRVEVLACTCSIVEVAVLIIGALRTV